MKKSIFTCGELSTCEDKSKEFVGDALINHLFRLTKMRVLCSDITFFNIDQKWILVNINIVLVQTLWQTNMDICNY